MTLTGNKALAYPTDAAPVELPRTVIVVPTYNEALTLPSFLCELADEIGPDDLVLVVDDGSPDGTGAIADSLAEELPFVRVLHRPRKEGLGRAYEAGFRYALELGAEFVVEMDADFSHRPNDLPRLMEEAPDAALVIGSRYVALGSARGLQPLRRLLSRAGSLYARVILELPVHDLTGGFKRYIRTALECVLERPISSSGYVFQIETTYRVARGRLRVVEVPIVFDSRRAGASKMRWTIAAEALLRVPLLRLEAASERARAVAADRRLDWQSIAVAWLLSRVVVAAAAVAPVRLGLVHFKHGAQLGSSALGPLLSWDTRWYESIAARGYYVIPGRQSDVAFFPLYPTVLHILRLAGASGWWVGSLVSTVLFLPALLLAYELVRSWLPRPDARRAAIYLALSPLGFVFTMVYPEALVLALVGGAAVAVVKRHYALGLVAGALAGLGRPEAVFVVLPLVVAVRRAWPALSQRQRVFAAAAAGAPLAGVGGFVLYQWARLQTPFAYESAQKGWGRHFSPVGISTAVAELLRAGRIHDEWLWRDAAFLLIYLAALALAVRARVPWPWLAAAAAVVLVPLESGSLTSISRFGLLAPALFAGLAYAGRRWFVDVGITAASIAALAFFSLTIPLHWP